MPFLLIFGLLFALAIPQQAQANAHTCLVTTALVEQREKLPRGLLYAIALTESGRWNKDQRFSHAWPWTIRASADAFVADDKSEAIHIVQRLQREGRENIDVGCMQINLKYHPDAFPNLRTAFEPLANITYAARFLRSLRAEAKSWQQAIQWYHSRHSDRGKAYRKKVYGHWQTAQIQINKAHQALALTGWTGATAIPPLFDEHLTPTLASYPAPNVKEQGRSRASQSSSLSATPKKVNVLRGQSGPGSRPGEIVQTDPLQPTISSHQRASMASGIQVTSQPYSRRPIHGVDIIRPR